MLREGTDSRLGIRSHQTRCEVTKGAMNKKLRDGIHNMYNPIFVLGEDEAGVTRIFV